MSGVYGICDCIIKCLTKQLWSIFYSVQLIKERRYRWVWVVKHVFLFDLTEKNVSENTTSVLRKKIEYIKRVSQTYVCVWLILGQFENGVPLKPLLGASVFLEYYMTAHVETQL